MELDKLLTLLSAGWTDRHYQEQDNVSNSASVRGAYPGLHLFVGCLAEDADILLKSATRRCRCS